VKLAVALLGRAVVVAVVAVVVAACVGGQRRGGEHADGERGQHADGAGHQHLGRGEGVGASQRAGDAAGGVQGKTMRHGESLYMCRE